MTGTEADVTGGPFYSYESQFAADELAKAAVKAQGQAIANDRGTCDELKIYVGNYSKEFTPKCPTCQYADPITVTPDLMGQFFTSTRSQEEADALAKAYIDSMQDHNSYHKNHLNIHNRKTHATCSQSRQSDIQCYQSFYT